MYRVAAKFAQKPGFFPIGRKVPAEFIGDLMTAFTHDERFADFYPHDGDEKQIKIMINPHLIGLVKTAVGTPSGIFVYFPGLRRYAANKKEHKFILLFNRPICNFFNPH